MVRHVLQMEQSDIMTQFSLLEILSFKHCKKRTLLEIQASKIAIDTSRIFYIPFESVSEYLLLLELVCEHLRRVGPLAIFYLAAAVSDFYLPVEKASNCKPLLEL
jgi:hypothetical protein